MKIPVDSIEIPERVRKDLGDLTPLMESLQKIGQLNPITVTPDFKLVAGHRRLTAVRQLGWKTIEAQIVEAVDELRCLEMELEENLYRKDFTPDEVLAGWKRLDALRHPRLSRRIATGMKKFFSRLAFWRRKPATVKTALDAPLSGGKPLPPQSKAVVRAPAASAAHDDGIVGV